MNAIPVQRPVENPVDHRLRASGDVLDRVPWRAVAVFVVTAYLLAWLVVLPLWLSGGLTNPLLTPLGLAMMGTPAVAALIATLLMVRPRHPARFLGLAPVRPVRRLVGYSLLGFVAPQLIGLLAIAVGSALGIAPITISAQTGSLLASMPLLSLLTAVPALGEELGWRGFLLPALRPLGTWPALLIMGVVWGAWHAPLILLGYNYGRPSPVGVLLMCVTTVLIGFLLGWLRMRSASVYPAAFAHGAVNASAGLLLVALLPAGSDDIAPSLLGWIGWSIVGLTALSLAIAGTYQWAGSSTSAGVETHRDR